MIGKVSEIRSRMGISTNIVPQLNLKEAVFQLSEDCKLVELELEHAAKMVIHDAQVYDETVKYLLELRRSRALHFSVHSPYRDSHSNLAAIDEDVRQAFCQTLKKVICFCFDIKAGILTCHPGYIKPGFQNESIRQLQNSLNVLVPYAKTRGVKISLENGGLERSRTLLLSPEQHIELCQRTGSWLTLDLVHLASYLSQDSEVIEDLDALLVCIKKNIVDFFPYIKNIHIADMPFPKHNHIPLQRGNLPIDKILDFLAQKNYQSNLVLDSIGGGSFSPDTYLEQLRHYRSGLEMA